MNNEYSWSLSNVGVRRTNPPYVKKFLCNLQLTLHTSSLHPRIQPTPHGTVLCIYCGKAFVYKCTHAVHSDAFSEINCILHLFYSTLLYVHRGHLLAIKAPHKLSDILLNLHLYVSCIGRQVLYHWATWEVQYISTTDKLELQN